MSGEQTTGQETTTVTPDSSVSAEPAVVEATPPSIVLPTEEPKTEDKSGKLVELRTSDFKKLKEKEREEGRKRAFADLNSRAIGLGFSSIEEMFDSHEQGDISDIDDDLIDEEDDEMATITTKSKKTTKNTSARRSSNNSSTNGKSGTSVSPRKARQLERENEKLRERNEKATRQWKTSEKRRRDLQRKLDAKDVEMELREQAVLAGVTDVDYALRLLSRRLAGKSEEDLASFDEKQFFTDLKESKPYLFGEQVVPATTGNGSSEDPPAPSSDEVNKDSEAGHFNARTASREDVDKRLRSLGLDPNV